MDKRTADALLRAINTPAGSRVSLTKALRAYLAENHIGTIKGEGVTFTAAEQAKLSEHLHGMGFGRYTGGPLGQLTRTERLSFVANEKLGGGPVRRDRIAIKAMAGRPLLVAGKCIDLPPGSHLDIAWPLAAEGIGHRTAVVVENWESFEGIDRALVSLAAGDLLAGAVAVYRGDTDTKVGDVLRFLEATGLQTIAYGDLDPAGLVIAAGFPGLVGLLAPSECDIRSLLQAPDKVRPDRYHAQLPMARERLDQLPPEHPVAPLWAILREARTGLMQESISSENIELHIWPGSVT